MNKFLICTLFLAACATGGKTAANIGVDLTDATCKALDADMQNEPEYVKFTCSIIEAGSPVAHTVITKVRKVDAKAFGEGRCVKDGGGAPTP